LFLKKAEIREGVKLHLEKRVPLAAGLGGGSANAAGTLLGMNELFANPLSAEQLFPLAAKLGSDVPFFLQDKPALATGRGEKITSLDFFPVLAETALVLVHPGFGIASAWAYQQLQRFPAAVNGQAGRAARLVGLMRAGDLNVAGREFYNSLEAPALEKYPLLLLFQEFFREHGAVATLMSGSGSTTFALTRNVSAAHELLGEFKARFGPTHWTTVCPLGSVS
jgi:4-diphosphocytidyl-2-C-methyl-D-erythritol kinase